MGPEREEKLDQLEKILHSRTFQGAESLKAFLRFVVLETIDNGGSHLKEYTIATQVFGRDNTYDPRIDSVVRVQAGRLRTKLQEFYATEGKSDKVIIDLPKGHYTPAFSYVPDGSVEVAPPGLLPSTARTEVPPRASTDRLNILIFVTAACVILALIFGILALKYRAEAARVKDSQPVRSTSGEVSAVAPLWSEFFHSPEPILVAFSNTVFKGTAETGMKLLNPLDSPVANFGSPPASQGAGVIDSGANVLTVHYTGVGEVMGVHFLASLFSNADHPFRVKRSLLLTWEDLKTENVVVLGSSAENLLMRELPQQQDFLFSVVKDKKDNEQFGILNVRPQHDEQKVYLARQEGPSRSQVSEDYALVSLFQGLDAKHRLLVLAGITTYGTQAAAECVTRPEYVRELIAHLNTSRVAGSVVLPRSYQVLVKVRVNGGVPVQVSYVTHHVLK